MILVMCANVISIRLHAPAKVLRCLKISPLLILMWPSGRQVERNWLRNQGMSHGDYHDILISKVAKNIAKHIHFDGRIPTCFNRKSNEVHMGHIGKETNSKGKLPLQNKLQKWGITCAGREKSNHIWQQIKQQICRCAHREIYTVSIYCLLLACLSNWKTVRLELFQFKTSPIPSRTKPLHTPKKHHPTLTHTVFFLTVFISFGTPVAGEASGSIALWVLLKSNNCRLVWATGTGKTLLVGWVHVVI